MSSKQGHQKSPGASEQKTVSNQLIQFLSCSDTSPGFPAPLPGSFHRVEDKKPVASSCSSTSTTANKPDHSSNNSRSTSSRVQFLNLHQVYQKVQSRVGRESKQRLVDARVRMVVTFDAQIEGIQIFVERVPEAAILLGDNTGRVELEPKMGDLVLNKQYLSVDLDSVYLSPQGTPVYKLSTVDAEKRNRFRIVVFIKFIDGTKSRPYFSRPFLIRSRRSSRQDSV